MRRKIFTLLTLLLCAVSGAWADTADFTLTSSSAATTVGEITLTGFSNKSNSGLNVNTATLTIAASDGYVISGVSFTFAESNRVGGTPVVASADHYAYSLSSLTGTISLKSGGSAQQSLTFQTTGNCRITAMTVTYSSSNSAPSFSTNLSSTADVGIGIAKTFTIVATGANSYQWYTCDDTEKSNPVAIDGATSASYDYTASVTGTVYLYCAATNANGTTNSTVCAVTAYKAAQKILYSLAAGIGSAEVTAADATVNTGTSLVLSNTNGRIKLTAKSGETFKNGDAFTFSGTIGNTSKAYGVKYGSTTSLGTNLYVAAGEACSVSGSLTLAENSNDLYIGRYDGSTTTLTTCVISRTMFVSTETFGGITINGVAATEGVDYTIAGSTITLTETYNGAPTVKLINNVTYTDASNDVAYVDVALTGNGTNFSGSATIGATTYTVVATVTLNYSIDFTNDTWTGGLSTSGVTNTCWVTAVTADGVPTYETSGPDSYLMYFEGYLKDNTYGLYYGNPKFQVPVAPGCYKITLGCSDYGGDITISDGSSTLTTINNNGGKYSLSKANVSSGYVTVNSACTITATTSANNVYFPYFAIEAVSSLSASTLSGRNYATMVTPAGVKLDFASAEGVTAYIATGLNGTSNGVVITPVDIVPANTPIIVKTDTKGATVNVPVTTADASDVSDNKLIAGDGTTAYNAVAGKTIYYLASDQFHLANDGTLQSGKAYLAVATGSGSAPQLSIDIDGISTGINTVEKAQTIENGVFFDLQGRKVAQPTKGLYIVNGKKVVVK